MRHNANAYRNWPIIAGASQESSQIGSNHAQITDNLLEIRPRHARISMSLRWSNSGSLFVCGVRLSGQIDPAIKYFMGEIQKEANHCNCNHSRVVSSPGRSTSQLFLFARNFVKHPNMVGWMLPSSRFVVDSVLKQVDWEQARVIVEYGPGVGTFTTRLLERMRPDATLIALETNPEFFRFLSDSLHDPRLRLVLESATEIEMVLARLGYAQADYVISGIPFKTLPHPLRDTIVRKTHTVLRPKGSFLVYQLSSVVLPYLEQVFGRVSRDFELLNFVPARLFFCAR